MPDSYSPGIEDSLRPIGAAAFLRADDARPAQSAGARRHDGAWPPAVAGDREAQRPDQDRPEAIAELDSFVAGLAASAAPWTVAALRAGAELSLRRRDRSDFRPGGETCGQEIQVWTAEGQPLGRLPPEDAAALDRLAAPGRPVTARVSAVVPAFLRPRVQVRIAFAQAPDDSAPRTA